MIGTWIENGSLTGYRKILNVDVGCIGYFFWRALKRLSYTHGRTNSTGSAGYPSDGSIIKYTMDLFTKCNAGVG